MTSDQSKGDRPFVHPKMLYHIMNHIKMNGSIDSEEIVDLVNQFSDINTEKTVSSLDDTQYVKYARYGLESLVQTMDKHKEGKFKKE